MPNPDETPPNLPLGSQSKPSNLVKRLLILIVLILVGIGAFLGLKQFNLLPISKPPILSNTPNPSSTPTPNVLYPQNYDPSGRNIYYQTAGTNVNQFRVTPFAGVGIYRFHDLTEFTLQKTPVTAQTLDGDKVNTIGVLSSWWEEGPESLNKYALVREASPSAMTEYIVGTFDSWENIPNSEDNYIILKDQMQVRDANGQLLSFPKVKVGEKTTLHVEDLSKVIPNFDDKLKVVPSYEIGKVTSLTANQLSDLIKTGDTVALKVFLDPKLNKDFADERGNKVASDLFIRRFNPVEALEKEISIKLNK